MTQLYRIVTTSSHIIAYFVGDIGNYHLFIEEIYYDYIVKILRTFVQIVANVLGGIFLMYVYVVSDVQRRYGVLLSRHAQSTTSDPSYGPY